MDLMLYNTLTAKKEPFETLEPGHARIYVCGPTVYDYAHIGHVRACVVFDLLVRYLRECGLKVTYVRNITDIDDKIIKRAAETGREPAELAEAFTLAFHQDMSRVAVGRADVEPRVSQHLPQIHALIGELVDKGVAYACEGDVYFSVESFADYGKLSHRSLSQLRCGASGRLSDEEERRKRDPADFALWKRSQPGEPAWPSPWGPGRPGWHIECSAMSMHYLGESFDLHGGGLDLVFPHHENEIAQSEAATGKPLARHWMHNGFIEVAKEKMSKSLGNFFTARECFRVVEPEALRYFLLTVHYRAPLNLDWTVDDEGQVTGFPQIEEAERRVEYIYATQRRLRALAPERMTRDEGAVPRELGEFPGILKKALSDDLNMPVALAVTADFLKQVNELAEGQRKKGKSVSLAAVRGAEQGFAVLSRLLGLGADDSTAFLGRVRKRRAEARGMTEEEIEKAIADRIEARKRRDFEAADAIRSRLAEKQVELMDGPDGTTWRIA